MEKKKSKKKTNQKVLFFYIHDSKAIPHVPLDTYFENVHPNYPPEIVDTPLKGFSQFYRLRRLIFAIFGQLILWFFASNFIMNGPFSL